MSVGDADWQEIPRPLRGRPGGMLALAAEVDDRIVAFGTAPELGRFFVFSR